MKIAYVTPSLIKCGPNVVLQNTILGMVDKNVECEVFYFSDSDNDMSFEANTNKVRNLVHLYRGLRDFDIIHSNGFQSDLFVVLLKLFTPLKSRTITTVHNNVFHDLYYGKGFVFSLLFGFLWSVLFCFFDVRTFLSNKAIEYYWFLPFKFRNHVVYNCINEEYDLNHKFDIRSYFDIPKRSRVIGTCANVNKRKGLDKIIKNMHPDDDVYFIIIGDGNYKSKLQSLVSDKGLNEKVKFHPFTKEPLDFISQFDLFVMPSLNEGFGLTVIESISVDTPVVCSNIDVFRELFSGMVVFLPEDNTFDLKKIICHTLINKEKLNNIGKSRITEKFSLPAMSSSLFDIYMSCLRSV